MQNSSINTDELEALLERLYPDVHISRQGVALLAAQIGELENKCELIRNRIDDLGMSKTPAQWPLTFYGRNNYGANDHTK